MVDGGENIVEASWDDVSGIMEKVKRIFLCRMIKLMGQKNEFVDFITS